MAELLLYLPATGVAEASPGKKKKKVTLRLGRRRETAAARADL